MPGNSFLEQGCNAKCQALHRTGNIADRAEKGEIKDARQIIVIQSVVWYNFSVADSEKFEFVLNIIMKFCVLHCYHTRRFIVCLKKYHSLNMNMSQFKII